MENTYSRRILVVDERPEIRELLRVTLEAGPYKVLMANTGGEGLRLAQQEKPDLVLLDILLSDRSSGLTICREIKQGSATQNIPVIFITSQAQDHDKEAAYAAGADDIVVKPFSPTGLLHLVKNELGI